MSDIIKNSAQLIYKNNKISNQINQFDSASDNIERDLIEQVALLSTINEYAWKQRCEEFIESMEEQSRIKHSRLSIDNRQSHVSHGSRV